MLHISLWSCCFGLETTVIIKISTHLCYPRNFGWLSWGWSKKKIIFFEKKTRMTVFPSCQFWIFFSKNFRDWTWVARIEWCEGHWCGLTYTVVRLSKISSKITKYTFFLPTFELVFCQSHNHIGWATSMPFVSINPTKPRTNL